MLVTGHSGQSLDWIAEHSDGWIFYPRDFQFLEQNLFRWKTALENTNQHWKPYMQSLYLDLLEDDKASPKGIHLGFQSGSEYALSHLKSLERYGVNHVIINLKYSSRPAEEVLEELGEKVLPCFYNVEERYLANAIDALLTNKKITTTKTKTICSIKTK